MKITYSFLASEFVVAVVIIISESFFVVMISWIFTSKIVRFSFFFNWFSGCVSSVLRRNIWTSTRSIIIFIFFTIIGPTFSLVFKILIFWWVVRRRIICWFIWAWFMSPRSRFSRGFARVRIIFTSFTIYTICWPNAGSSWNNIYCYIFAIVLSF